MPEPGGGSPKRGPKKTTIGQRKSHDIGIQCGYRLPHKSRRCVPCMLCSVWTMAVVVAVMATAPTWGGLVEYLEFMLFPNDFVVGPEMMEDLGMDGVMLFKQHDRDGDGVLSLEEFEPIAHRLLQMNNDKIYETTIDEWDEVVTIQSHFTPLEISSMSKAKDAGFLDITPGSLDSLHGLRFWQQPVNEWKNFAAAHLKYFLPDDPHMLDGLGEVYYLIQPLENSDGAVLSSNRYEPPPLLKDPAIMIHRLLSMFHHKPFVYSRFSPQGSVAIIRATSHKYVDISFRLHVEFQLNNPPFYPFWFTPAQFTGNIVMSKDGTRVISFQLHVPCDRLLNVDMEWLNGPKEQENMEVDIGKMERMELTATRSSLPAFDGGVDHTETFISGEGFNMKEILWDKEISHQKAQRELEVKMYPFKEVAYHNFTEAYRVAREVNKPVHSILLWGALDDQSC